MIDDPLNRLKVRRGSQLPWAKLTEEDVIAIWRLVRERERLRRQIKSLSNEAIAEKFGVSVRTIERILYDGGWAHVVPDEATTTEE